MSVIIKDKEQSNMNSLFIRKLILTETQTVQLAKL